jgi:1-phosphofructokinase family hexose kinase
MVVPNFRPGEIYRPEGLLIAPGGKSINVARALRCLGGESLCCGFLGGHNGRWLAALAEQEGQPAVWTWIEGETRTCTIVTDPITGAATVLNENGPQVTAADWLRLSQSVLDLVSGKTGVCFSGSLPPGSPQAAFVELVRAVRAKGMPVWVDTSGEVLRAVLDAGTGAIIKVNGDEAGAILGRAIPDAESALAAAETLQIRTGAPVVLTLGADGAVMAQGAGRYRVQPPRVKIMDVVGSGDSFLAGLALATSRREDPGEALRQAAAAGAANVMTVGGGSLTRADFEAVLAETRLTVY